MAIVYVCFYRGTDKQSPAAKVAAAQKEAAAVEPATPAQNSGAQTPPPTGGTTSLKAPIDRTRSVLQQVQTRNGE